MHIKTYLKILLWKKEMQHVILFAIETN